MADLRRSGGAAGVRSIGAPQDGLPAMTVLAEEAPADAACQPEAPEEAAPATQHEGPRASDEVQVPQEQAHAALKVSLSDKTCQLMSNFEFNRMLVMLDPSSFSISLTFTRGA